MIKKIKVILKSFIMPFFNTNASNSYKKLAYDFKFNGLNGKILSLDEYKNKIIIVVNVASQCGFTNQYKHLQKVWEEYYKKGIVVVGIPSNDFGEQEPGNSKEINTFCETQFGINFPMTEKIYIDFR